MDKLPEYYNDMSKKELKEQLLFQMNQNIRIVSENVSLVRNLDKYRKLLEVSVEIL